ncbi:MAG TPA: SRPBCC family protein [Ktedonobacterales bacterium]|nr:SRPBCC family protein [Ktedonobacterales bacterium]
MGEITIKAAATLDARPEDVYATIADYHEGHPSILPKDNLYDLQVEQGGYGAGTVIHFKSRVLGMERSFHHRVSEPEPGRVLVEQDVDPNAAQPVTTTFTVTPVAEGRKSHVEIASLMQLSPGVQGWFERVLVPRVTVPVYSKELKLLEASAQRRGNALTQTDRATS